VPLPALGMERRDRFDVRDGRLPEDHLLLHSCACRFVRTHPRVR
jgi:hypothetical protein